MGWVWEFLIPTSPGPVSFNFLNGTGMRIILNKRGKVRMRATRPKPVSLSSLVESIFQKDHDFLTLMSLREDSIF